MPSCKRLVKTYHKYLSASKVNYDAADALFTEFEMLKQTYAVRLAEYDLTLRQYAPYGVVCDPRIASLLNVLLDNLDEIVDMMWGVFERYLDQLRLAHDNMYNHLQLRKYVDIVKGHEPCHAHATKVYTNEVLSLRQYIDQTYYLAENFIPMYAMAVSRYELTTDYF